MEDRLCRLCKAAGVVASCCIVVGDRKAEAGRFVLLIRVTVTRVLLLLFLLFAGALYRSSSIKPAAVGATVGIADSVGGKAP